MTINPEYTAYPMNQMVTVELPIADWHQFIAWAQVNDTDGVTYLIFGKIVPQVVDYIFTPASQKAVAARIAEQHANHPIHQLFQMFQNAEPIPSPDEFVQPYPNCRLCGGRAIDHREDRIAGHEYEPE